jgi:hypothetical protein
MLDVRFSSNLLQAKNARISIPTRGACSTIKEGIPSAVDEMLEAISDAAVTQRARRSLVSSSREATMGFDAVPNVKKPGE